MVFFEEFDFFGEFFIDAVADAGDGLVALASSTSTLRAMRSFSVSVMSPRDFTMPSGSVSIHTPGDAPVTVDTTTR